MKKRDIRHLFMSQPFQKEIIKKIFYDFNIEQYKTAYERNCKFIERIRKEDKWKELLTIIRNK